MGKARFNSLMMYVITLISVISLILNGCAASLSDTSSGSEMITPGGNEAVSANENDDTDSDGMAEVYGDIFDQAENTDAGNGLETIRSIVSGFGEKGIPAVDSENRINMVCPERIRQFCGYAEAGKEAQAALIVVISADDFIRYDFTAEDGNVDVERSYWLLEDGQWEAVSVQNYPAYTWVYSGEGYLFFEEYHMPGYDGPSGHTAVRIEPLDETCRELTGKYISPIGYRLNNIFTLDWDEDDFGEVDFYDLYEPLCQMNNGQYAATSYDEGESYEIPESEFESVFQSYFRLDVQTLRQYAVYHEDTHTYQYRTRGMFDFAPTPYHPYPEVVSYQINQDGTVTLIVNAVWPEQNLEKAFCHEVVIRPMDGGGFQYVSNHVISMEENIDTNNWYTERLTDEEWQEYYGELQ